MNVFVNRSRVSTELSSPLLKIYRLIDVTFGISNYIATNDNINSQQGRQRMYNVGFRRVRVSILILSDFNSLEFSRQIFFFLILKYQISWKILQFEPSCTVRTDMAILIVGFRYFFQHPWKGTGEVWTEGIVKQFGVPFWYFYCMEWGKPRWNLRHGNASSKSLSCIYIFLFYVCCRKDVLIKTENQNSGKTAWRYVGVYLDRYFFVCQSSR